MTSMSATFASSPARDEARQLFLAVIAGFACAFALARVLPLAIDAVSATIEPLCAASAGSALDTVEPIASYALPNVPGKSVTIVRVFYGPGGFPARTATPARSRPTSPRAKSVRSSAADRSRRSRSGSRFSSRRVRRIWSRQTRATPSPPN